MPLYSQNVIRLAASLVSQPPVNPVDSNTGQQPRFWRAQNLGVAFAVFDSTGACVDLSDLAFLELAIFANQDDLLPVFPVKVIDAADIVPSISRGLWNLGQAWQGLFQLTKAETDASLDGDSQRDFWITITGQTSGGDRTIYIAGYITIYNAGNGLPLPPFGYVSRHDQTLSEGDITLTPTSLDHTEVITVGGVARTSNVVLSIAGISSGALCRIRWELPGTADIIVNTRNATIGGDVLQTFTTGIFANGFDLYSYDEANATWNRLQSQYPAT